MVSFSGFALFGNSPVYLQMILYIKRGIAAGRIADGDELPSRRALSALLGLNTNTVQKSCRILEEEGIICSTPGAKSIVTVDSLKIASIRQELMRQEAQIMALAMKQMGVSMEEALTVLQDIWDYQEETT